jgi:hypothetical protein
MKEKDDEDKQICDVYFWVLVPTFVKLESMVGSSDIICTCWYRGQCLHTHAMVTCQNSGVFANFKTLKNVVMVDSDY